MQKKQMLFKTKGMNRDLSVSAFNPEFAFENINLRLSTNENNTLMSWVNEKGTEKIKLYEQSGGQSVELKGTPIGTAVINHKLVIFTIFGNAITEEPKDYIYVLEKLGTTDYRCTKIFSGNLKFQVDHPLETLVSYEADNIQKVYWTDNLNQPRVINIAKLLKEPEINNSDEVYTKFDFVASAKLDSTISVTKRLSGGMFAPGVIQYCYTYFNKYGQQSNIINVSPLYYLTHSDRGAAADDKVNNSFEITITNPDDSFDMVRLYSIHRTSLDAIPYILALEDFPIVGNTITYVDNGSTGATVDPTEMLFIGGKEITAYTMEEKDQTLFLGNITQKNDSLSELQEYFDRKRGSDNPIEIEFYNDIVTYELNSSINNLYSNTFTLNNDHRKISTFKGGDYYRFGFQLQKYTGEWSEPIFIDDKQNDKYPITSLFNENVYLPYAKANVTIPIPLNSSQEEFLKTYKRIRPVVVFPDIQDRVTLCQGVLNPTVFNVEDRQEKIPYAQASWNFRPYTINRKIEGSDDSKIIFTSGATSSTWLDSTGYTVMLLRIEAAELNYYLKHHFVDFEGNSSPIPTRKGDDIDSDEGQYRYYAALKLGTVEKLKSANDTKTTEYCDVLFWFKYPVEIEDYLRSAVDTGDNWGCPDENESKIIAWTGLNSDRINRFKFPNGVEPDRFCGMLQYTGEEQSVTFSVYFDSYDFKYGNTATTRGKYDITLYKEDVGSRIAFVHYESLYTTSDQEDNCIKVKDNLNDVEYYSETGRRAKQVEVQASKTRYNDVYITPNQDANNTQFFVDQSIVTLNSPDLDFNSDTYNYINGDINLRIIGMIPITASGSAHKIVTSSATLPLGYNLKDNDGNVREATEFGKGELDINTYWVNKSLNAGKRVVSEYLWNDAYLYLEGGNVKNTYPYAADYLIYPWHASRSLNNDNRDNANASSVLKTKVESTILYSCNTPYFQSKNIVNVEFEKSNAQIHLQENEFIENLKLSARLESNTINYYANIDKSLVYSDQWRVYAKNYRGLEDKAGAVLMRYKSGTHAVIALPKVGNTISLLPYASLYYYTGGNYTNVGKYEGYGNPYWDRDRTYSFNQVGKSLTSLITPPSGATRNAYDFLWLGELYKDVDPNFIFGGKGRQAIQANKWLVGGETQELTDLNSPITLTWTEGDTFYQRYDCLKTYPYSDQDPNQMVEILSFMCESHVNLDGRYDRNRGQRDNTMMSPVNFNLMNSVYNQKDNFFTYKKTEDDNISTYPNLITFTKTKESGADIDQWTNITLASNLELDGGKGEISSIQRLNNQLFAFQDSGISQILYNESVQIASTEGVPIEIANSQKVQGKRYYSNSIGCSNKYSICNTPSGIYFIDSNDKGIYLFNGELNNISNKGGFNTWCKTNIFSNKKWNPDTFEDFVTYYDKQNQDVLFIDKEHCLAFSEKLGAFTSFYNYENTPYFCNLDDDGLWLKGSNLWLHRGSKDYCKFFGNYKPFSITLVGNPEPQIDKIFTNLEFRASVDGEGEGVDKYKPFLPFDKLEAWNEYQKGYTNLKDKDGHNPYKHHDGVDSTLLRKFRIWRCDIPRDNDSNGRKAHPMDRMRNPWLYLKLEKSSETSKRTEIHDVVMTYFD